MPARHLLAVTAVAFALSAAAAQPVAWAEPGQADSPHTHAGSASVGAARAPRTPAVGKSILRDQTSPTETKPTRPQTVSAGATTQPDADSASPTGSPVVPSDSAAPKHYSHAGTHNGKSRTSIPAGPTQTGRSPFAPSDNQPHRPATSLKTTAATRLSEAATAARPAAAQTSTQPPASAAAVDSSSSSITTPRKPEPLSPIARLIALPGRIINVVLQALDFTVSSTGPKSPLNFAPIDEFIFAVFRRVEDALGLNKIPAKQQVLQTETYTGPTATVTPTVAQFLDAATAEYGLGTTPAGLQPFTVNGVQMASTNIWSGESAQAWVTPAAQIIIAYQGTTGGTNLLVNPLIAISQIVADLQVIFTDTTPQVFTDALKFEERVQAAAAAQGYSSDDIFVTGHSLGGWEAEYVAQQTGLGGIGFESPGMNSKVAGNGNSSGFVNIETYGDTAAYFSTDLPGLQPFMPAYVAGGGSKPHYGSIVVIGDPNATTPLINASALWGTSVIGDIIFAVDILVNFFEHHLPGMQAHNLDVAPDPGVVPWLGSVMGPIETGYGDMTIPQLQQAASNAGTLIAA
jgi:hypothetical protein